MTTPLSVCIADDVSAHVAMGILQFSGLSIDVDFARPAPDLPDPAVIDERTAMVRTMYRRIGIDPTKTRPSSEALLRRVKRGQTWPQVNPLVDVCNECSLAVQLPFGLYDREHIVGNVVLRQGRVGEQYEGIRKSVVHLTGRPALFDEIGPFGNPTSDSARTMVTGRTTEALIVVFSPTSLARSALDEVLARTAAAVGETAGGVEHERRVVSSETRQGTAGDSLSIAPPESPG